MDLRSGHFSQAAARYEIGVDEGLASGITALKGHALVDAEFSEVGELAPLIYPISLRSMVPFLAPIAVEDESREQWQAPRDPCIECIKLIEIVMISKARP